jgi:transposase
MEVVHERCCGLDVHKKTVVACVITPERRQVRSFGTMTQDLLELGEWLEAEGVTHVAMESTGVYWKPVFNLLEGSELELLVVNARHMKAVPGRKTDVKDAEWIADLLRHGLLQPSFVPNREQRELRELVRHRRTLIEQRAHEVQRVQKVLEGANVKLSDVATDIMGVSGRAMLRALIEGEQRPEVLAELAQGRLKSKRGSLERALRSSVGAHQRYMLRHLLDHIEFLEREIADLDRAIEERMRAFEVAIARIDEIWGIGRRTAEEILAEVGLDMSRWPTHRHFASWAKVCPGNNESAGKRKSGRTGKGNRWLHCTLVEAANNVSRNRGTYYGAQYHRIARRRGRKRALVAVAHSLLTAIYYMLRDGTVHQDLGSHHFDRLDRERVANRLVQRLQRLGFKVTLEPAAA